MMLVVGQGSLSLGFHSSRAVREVFIKHFTSLPTGPISWAVFWIQKKLRELSHMSGKKKKSESGGNQQFQVGVKKIEKKD
jgi:hypothetical protein